MREKTPQDWIDEIDNALLYREIFGREAAWKKIELNYLNDPNSDTAIGPNLVYSMGDSLLSSLTVPDPEFVVSPERRIAVERAPIVESLDNYLVRKLRFKRYIDMALLRGYLYGSAILKFGYDSEYGWAPYYDIGNDNNLLGITFTQFDNKGRRIESPDFQPGWPWVRPVLPHDIAVPWGTIFLDDAPWISHRIVRHIDWLKADPKYKNTTSLKPTHTMKDFMESYLTVGSRKLHQRVRQAAKSPEMPEFVELWEITDRVRGERLVVSRDADKFLRKTPDAIQAACGMPYVAVTLTPHPRSFWSTPPAYYLGQMQKTQFDISLQTEKQRRLSLLKFLFRKGAMTSAALSRLLSSDAGAAEGVEGMYPLGEVIQPLQSGTPLDMLAHDNKNRSDAREAIGFSRNQLGDYDTSSRRTASEAQFVAAGAERRTNKKEQMVAQMYIEAIEKINQLIFSFWQMPREIMHDEGFENVTGPMLKGDYLYDISLTTKRSISRAERKVEALMMLSQIAPFLQGADVAAMFDYLTAAAGDPAFTRILAPMKSAGRPAAAAGGQSPQLPSQGGR